MPVYWTITPKAPGTPPGAFALAAGDGAEYRLSLMPFVSMGPKGFVRIIAISAAFLTLPLLAVLGTPVLWGLLPFAGLALWALWYALSRNSAERHALREDLCLTKERIEITRTNPRKPAQHWHANPYWVRVKLAEKDGVIENYLTLEGNGRVVELGAFLSPEERAELYAKLSQALRHLR
ncbi:MAG: DUF2244 domain-containing protein [Roseinatronobacter sp.]|uniref:Putative membrane protein n=1 Tax=Roseinatronobacter monicus TaxID=393481 RepID=A0A543KEA7_9RHOB|nr:DUF2244 domain-containing protein [Roseinatronobacter monicus]TQM93402.1 putative membrane protein [Roseinatronobacter monicus]TVP98532.1 MAG: DUF2244 domain-containing protein [Roseinatronobacter sp.]